jgi:hypothetical protein
MQKFTVHQGLVAPMDRENVDTDAIIPKQFLKSIRKTGFGPNLFDAWRYLDPGEPGQDPRSRRPTPTSSSTKPRYVGGVDPALPPQLRLRLVARARAVGAAAGRASAHSSRPSYADTLLQQRFMTACCRSSGRARVAAVRRVAAFPATAHVDLERSGLSPRRGSAFEVSLPQVLPLTASTTSA